MAKERRRAKDCWVKWPDPKVAESAAASRQSPPQTIIALQIDIAAFPANDTPPVHKWAVTDY